MRLADFFAPDAVRLALGGGSKDDVLQELAALLRVSPEDETTLVRLLKRREALTSTGVGRGVAIPHCRTLVVDRIWLAFGHHQAGIEYGAIDGQPAHHFFLLVAPPLGSATGQYLPILGRIARFAKEADVPERLATLRSADDFFALLTEKGV